jgi:Uma2 family endonuclease
MTKAIKLTFEEYLALTDADDLPEGIPEGPCEFIDGELVELPAESGFNDAIANYLFLILVNAGLPLTLVRTHTCELEVPVLKPRDSRLRVPDLIVLQPEHLPFIERRLLIRIELPPPQLVVEVVSPGERNQKRDYERKHEQYQERGIPEYWLIDPTLRAITVLELQSGYYQQIGSFSGTEAIQSLLLNSLNLTLTVKQIFDAVA